MADIVEWILKNSHKVPDLLHSSIMVFLYNELDSNEKVARLPSEKLEVPCILVIERCARK